MTDTFWTAVPRDVVMLQGPDAGTYLHSQLSQEVRPLAVGQSVWSFVLEPTGKVDALVRVLRSGDEAYVLDVDEGFGEALRARLERFKIRVNAELSVIPWQCVAVRGPSASGVAAPPGSIAVVSWRAGAVDLLGPAVPPLEAVREGSAGEYERARVVAGWPAMGAEIEPGSTIPAETGIVDLAVSFTKGCYPGQELVERMDSRGASAPRLLRRVLLPAGATAARGDQLWHDGRVVGEVTSAAGDAALALVSRSLEVPAAAALHESPRDLPARVEAVA